ncbi:enoyl-CoA hydratase/isomerase family protein [Variovorax sp. AFSI2.2]|uniref:enoyl-CoA hydratase/isomerase family protein n=1 Tax=Variovorax sp. AFSI2.2 TaxID=3384160 RepID=UPI003EBC7369
MDAKVIELEISDGYAVIVLNNPPMNVVSAPLTRQLYETLKALERADSVRALILTGAGARAFCAGSDITELTQMFEPGAALEKKLIFQNKVFEQLRSFPKPTIAALNGYVYGGGLEIAVCCDLIVAEAQVKLCLPEIKLGVFPSSGGTYRVARRIGEARAKEMVFLGEPITAAQALAWGLVNRVVDQGTALASAREIAQKLSRGPALALQAAKATIQLAFERSDAEAVGESLKASDRVFSSADAKEGISAFLEKRSANFA